MSEVHIIIVLRHTCMKSKTVHVNNSVIDMTVLNSNDVKEVNIVTCY